MTRCPRTRSRLECEPTVPLSGALRWRRGTLRTSNTTLRPDTPPVELPVQTPGRANTESPSRRTNHFSPLRHRPSRRGRGRLLVGYPRRTTTTTPHSDGPAAGPYLRPCPHPRENGEGLRCLRSRDPDSGTVSFGSYGQVNTNLKSIHSYRIPLPTGTYKLCPPSQQSTSPRQVPGSLWASESRLLGTGHA